jgi:hypothetical protein
VILPKRTKGIRPYIVDVLLGCGQREARIPQSTILVHILDQMDLCIFRRRNMLYILGDPQRISASLQSRPQYFDIPDSSLCGARIVPAAKSSPASV